MILISETIWLYRDTMPIYRHTNKDRVLERAYKERENYPKSLITVKSVQMTERDLVELQPVAY